MLKIFENDDAKRKTRTHLAAARMSAAMRRSHTEALSFSSKSGMPKRTSNKIQSSNDSFALSSAFVDLIFL